MSERYGCAVLKLGLSPEASGQVHRDLGDRLEHVPVNIAPKAVS